MSRETDVVEHGSTADVLDQLTDESQDFFEGDVLRVHDGGEGLLDFGDAMVLRLFNDTQMDVVSVESAEDAPLGCGSSWRKAASRVS